VTRLPLITTVLVLLGLGLANVTIDQALGLGLINLTIDQRPGLEIGGVTVPTPPTDEESSTEATILDAVLTPAAQHGAVAQLIVLLTWIVPWPLDLPAPPITRRHSRLHAPWRPERLAGADHAAPRPPPV
jgi:hypothetical protein